MEVSLGRGRFSVVKKTSDGTAVKVIEVDDQQKPHNYRCELAALARLQTAANVVRVLKIEEFLQRMDPEVRIYMPCYEFTLEHVVYHYAKASYPPGSGWRNVMPLDTVRRIALGVSRALQACHEAGIIHRDLKPENVLFRSPEDEPVLIDFGIAWVPDISDRSEPAGDRETDVSTCEFKAPELLYGIRNYNEKIDMWSLGCMLMPMLGSDCKSLFSPYLSDIRLISAQFELLGRPDIRDCPSFIGTAAESVISTEPVPGKGFNLRPLDAQLQEMFMSLLEFEPTRRPSAAQLVDYLTLDQT